MAQDQLALLAIGLLKKLDLADALAVQSDAVFEKAVKGAVSLTEAWSGMLSFTFHIYFDFSGYSDMAICLALLVNRIGTLTPDRSAVLTPV